MELADEIHVSGRRSDAAFWLLAASFAACFVWLHLRAGYTFPTPWPDEVAYLWQGIALARSGSPVAPELVPNVHLMWIPPGFMLVNAAFFWAMGFSLDLARWLSAGELLVCFGALCVVARRLRAPWVSLLLCGLFLCSARFVMAGNIGRMEALVLAFVAAGLLLFSRERWLSGLAITACSALVHPNGALFTGGALLFLALQPQRFGRLTASDRRQWIVLGVVACGFLAYAVYIVAQWDAFVLQMGAQFGRKLERDLAQTIGRPGEWGYLIALAALLARSVGRDARAMLLCCFAFGAWLTCWIGQEWWYEVNRGFGSLLLGLAGIELAGGAGWKPGIRPWAAPIAAAIALAIFWGTGALPFPPADPSRLKANHMRIRPDWARVDRDEFSRMADRMRNWTQCSEPVVVRVYPRADSLVLYEALGGQTSVLFSSPPYVFEAMGREDPRYAAPAWDAFLIHLTEEPVPYAWPQLNAAFLESGIQPSSREDLVQFDGPGSQWYLRVRKLQVLAKCLKSSEAGDD